MMLGNTAVSTYCLLFAALWRQLSAESSGAPVELTLAATSLLCYVLASFCVSIPIFALLAWRKNQVETGQAGTPEEQAEAATEVQQRAEDEREERMEERQHEAEKHHTAIGIGGHEQWAKDLAAVELGKKEPQDELKQPLFLDGSS